MKITKKLVNRIVASPHSNGKKLFQLFAVTMLNYRGPVADYAWDEIQKTVGADMANAGLKVYVHLHDPSP